MIDPNTAMSAAGEGAKAVSKFEEILQKIYGPKWTRKQADADAYADARKLQTIRDNPDMEIVFANGQMNARARPLEELALRAGQRQLAESIRQEENLENVIEIAENEIQSVEEVSPDSVEEDWITRFFNIVKDVSAEEMQFLWGKILAGEIAKPNSFSLRTLETIRNISPDEAKLFERLLPFIIWSGQACFIPADIITLTEFEVPFGIIMQMDECGLVNSSGQTIIEIKAMQNCDQQPILNSKVELLSVADPSVVNFDFNLRVYPLTRAAIELLDIIDYCPNHEFFLRLAKTIHVEHLSNANMTIFPITYGEDSKPFLDTNKPIYTFCKVTHQRSGF